MRLLPRCSGSIGKGLVPTLAVLLLLARTAAPARAQQIEAWLDTSVDVTSATGPGAAGVAVPRSGAATSWLGLETAGAYNGWDSVLSLSGHRTDNPLVDSRGWAMDSLYGEFSKRTTLVRLGDNQCTHTVAGLDNSIRGLYLKQGGLEYGQPELQVAAGTLLRNEQRTWPALARQPRANVLDLMVRHALNQAVTVGIEAAATREYHRPDPAVPLTDGMLYGLTWAYEPIWGVKFTGESHLSTRSQTPAAGSGHGSAHRFTFNGEGDHSRLLVVYERVSPDYIISLNRLQADREWGRAVWRQKMGQRHTLSLSTDWSHRDLEHTLPAAVRSFKPMVRFDARQLWGNPRTRAGVALYHLRSHDFSDAGQPFTAGSTFLRLDCGNRVGWLDMNLAVEREVARVVTGAVPDSSQWNIDATLSTAIRHAGNYIRPELSFVRTTRSEELTGTARDLLMERYAVGINANLPRSGLQGSLHVGTQKARLPDHATTGYASCGLYWKPFRKPAPARDVVAYVQMRYNDLNTDTPLSDYSSTVMTLGMNVLY